MGIQSDITVWATDTAGWPPTDAVLTTFSRAISEMEELCEAVEQERPAVETIATETADVLICLYRMASMAGFDLDAAVVRKMDLNYRRRWHRNGDGTAQHCPAFEVEGDHEPRPCERCARGDATYFCDPVRGQYLTFFIPAPEFDRTSEMIEDSAPPNDPLSKTLSRAPDSEDLDEPCPDCGGALFFGYGLTGGGLGPYEMCMSCDHFRKSTRDDQEDE